MPQVWELSFPPCSHLLHHAFHLGHIWYPSWSSTALHLFHHVLQSTHASHLFKHSWVNHLGHLLVQLSHLSRINLLVHVASLEKSLDATHLFHHLCKLGVLLQQLLHLLLKHPGPSSHPPHPARLPAELFAPISIIKLLVIHAVHDGHQLLEPGLALLLAALGHKVLAKPRDHPHDLRERAHLHHIRKLLVHVSKGELPMLELVHQPVIALAKLQLAHSLHQGFQVTHAQKFLNKSLRSKLLQVINVFSSTYENDRGLCGSNCTEGSSSLCMPVQLRHYHASNVHLVLECPSLSLTRLPNGGVHHKHNVVRIHRVAHRKHFLKERVLLLVSS